MWIASIQTEAPAMRWRVWTDRLIVLGVLIGAWQAGSALLGSYWLSSPWATVTRFFASLFSGCDPK
jgi:NitT/TauT family transport system permease protein